MSQDVEKQPTIFLVEEDDETRPILKRNLREQGYHVIVALDEEDALERVEGGRTIYGLLLVNVVGVQPDEALESARRIHRRAEMGSKTPIVVIAEKYGEEMEGKDVEVDENEYVTYPEDGAQLHNLLARLVPPAPVSSCPFSPADTFSIP
jgi:DNA-binding response OmpR family regulator